MAIKGLYSQELQKRLPDPLTLIRFTDFLGDEINPEDR